MTKLIFKKIVTSVHDVNKGITDKNNKLYLGHFVFGYHFFETIEDNIKIAITENFD